MIWLSPSKVCEFLIFITEISDQYNVKDPFRKFRFFHLLYTLKSYILTSLRVKVVIPAGSNFSCKPSVGLVVCRPSVHGILF